MELTSNGRSRVVKSASNMAGKVLLSTHENHGGSHIRGRLFVICAHERILLDGCCT